MHCPQCGKEQSFDKIRFCTRCGFALNDVKELLITNSREIKEKKKSKTRKGVSQGLALFLFGLVLISVLAILRDLEIVPQVFVKIAALVFCVGGAIRMCFPFIYGEGISQAKENAAFQNDAAHTLKGADITNDLLPPMRSNSFIAVGAQNFDTAELAQPPSIVTEPTTKLLQNIQPEKE